MGERPSCRAGRRIHLQRKSQNGWAVGINPSSLPYTSASGPRAEASGRAVAAAAAAAATSASCLRVAPVAVCRASSTCASEASRVTVRCSVARRARQGGNRASVRRCASRMAATQSSTLGREGGVK